MKKTEDIPMKVLKTAICNTLFDKSKLSYQIGLSPESIVHLRISKNSGAGCFSDEWIALDDILDDALLRPLLLTSQSFCT